VDGHAALKACAEELPSAVLLSPFLRGLDVFSFLQHLRHVRGAKDVPVLLMLPRQFEPRELEEIEQAAAEAAQQGTWYRQITRGTRSYAPAASDTSPRDTGEDEPRAS
jgi:CheY-like chemotaxis protein